MKKTREKLIGFLQKFFKVDTIDSDSDIFEMGYVNSLFAMQFITFIEEEFDITVDPTDMDRENFSSINRMITFVEKKCKQCEAE